MTSLHPACDAIAAQCAKASATAAHPNLVLITTILASSLAFVDGSVVNVALPTLARNFHADAGALQWVINAYLLPLSALLLSYKFREFCLQTALLRMAEDLLFPIHSTARGSQYGRAYQCCTRIG